MQPRQRIEELILSLNEISYDDHDRLEAYLGDLRKAVHAIFGEHNSYSTCLGYIRFTVSGDVVAVEERVRQWAKGKRELRDLLFVIHEDPLLDVQADSSQELLGDEAIFLRRFGARYEINSPLEDIVRAFKNRIRVDLRAFSLDSSTVNQTSSFDVRSLPRIRIDLRDLFIMEPGSEAWYGRTDRALRKNPLRRVLLVRSRDEQLNHEIRQFLLRSGSEVLEAGGPYLGVRSVSEQLKEFDDIALAVVALSDECRVRARDVGAENEFFTPSPATCFDFGRLIGMLGRKKVVALYRENNSFRRPTGFFDAFYVAFDGDGLWQHELAVRMGIEGVLI